jgi:hypothetical protein
VIGRLHIAALGAVLICLAAASSASAAVTSSSITTPAAPAYALIDFDAAQQQIQVAGQATINADPPGDTVNIECVFATGGATVLQQNVPVSGSGGFSAMVTPSGVTKPCVLRAIPSGEPNVPPGGSSNFQGPVLMPTIIGSEFTGADSSTPRYDFESSVSKPHGWWDHYQSGGCSINQAKLVDPATSALSDTVFFCNAWFLGANDGKTTPGTRSQLRIDDKNAYLPGAAQRINASAANFPGMPAPDVAYDPANGDYSVHTVERAVRCAGTGDPYPATSGNCADFTDTGVQVDTWITDHGDGTSSQVAQRFSSTDGGTHHVDALSDQETFHPTGHGGLRFPWADGDYRAYAENDPVTPPPAGPGSMYVKDDRNATNGTFAGAQGAITWAAAPGAIKFLYPTDGPDHASEFELAYNRTIGPGSPTWLGWSFALGTTPAGLESAAHDAETSFRPRVAITTGGTTPSATAHVTGTSADDSGDPVSVTLNGHLATVAQGGAWSADVPLAVGPNTLTATATNRYGNTATAQATVTRVTPHTPGSTKHVFHGASLHGSHTLKLDKHGNAIVSVSCPKDSTGACSGRATLVSTPVVAAAAKHKRVRIRLGSKSFKVPAGKTRKVKIHVSRKGRRTLVKNGRLKARLSVKSSDGSGPAKVKTATVTLKPAKRRH